MDLGKRPEAVQAPPGLVYVSDQSPGISRIRRGDAFVYRTPDGRPLRDKAHLERIRKLAIPPAYTDAWICTKPNGHLQATGRDARGRKQYRYHPQWRLARDADKFERMLQFGGVLPRVRRRVQRDLKRQSGRLPSREAVLAALVRLLDTTLVRIGNDEYVRTNGSYGLTTLRNRHVNVTGGSLRLRFKGKHGKVHDVSVDDPRVARIVQCCQAMPGQELFEYVDEAGQTRCVGSADVNEYLRQAAGDEISAKDFRTWHATVLAFSLIKASGEGIARRSDNEGPQTCRFASGPPRGMRKLRSGRAFPHEVLAEVAQRLGNTVAVCRKAYVHPRVLECAALGFSDGTTTPLKPRAGLSRAEAELLDFLQGASGLRPAKPRRFHQRPDRTGEPR